MTRHSDDDQKIRAYLLRALPEADIEHLDELSVTDDEFAGRLNTVENDLVDAYVRGELSGIELAQFQEHYLASPNRRKKVSLAGAFVALIDKQRIEGEKLKAGTIPFKSRFAQWGLAAAAAVILFSCGYLVLENARLRSNLAQKQAEYESLQEREKELRTQLSDQSTSRTDIQNELARVQSRLLQLEEQLVSGGEEPEKKELKLIAFHLSPQTRSISKITALTVPPSTDLVSFTLALEPNDFSMYQAALKDPSTNEIIWRRDNIKTDQGQRLQIQLPSRLFKAQNYVLEVGGITTDGSYEIVSTYPFRIVIR